MQKNSILIMKLKNYAETVKSIIEETPDPHSSSRGQISPDGIIYYNQLAKEFNHIYTDCLYVFREDTTANSVLHPKGLEVLSQIELAIRILEGESDLSTETNNNGIRMKLQKNKSNKVFIVHGHDAATKLEMARTLEKAGFIAIILHEQASAGKTVIEKIEANTDVAFAVVLYTPCDMGRAKEEKIDEERYRARQNVVFEHGYLIGKLGREQVCAFVKDSIETPGDISGVVYIPMDDAGAWKMVLAKEMSNAGLQVDMNKFCS